MCYAWLAVGTCDLIGCKCVCTWCCWLWMMLQHGCLWSSMQGYEPSWQCQQCPTLTARLGHYTQTELASESECLHKQYRLCFSEQLTPTNNTITIYYNNTSHKQYSLSQWMTSNQPQLFNIKEYYLVNPNVYTLFVVPQLTISNQYWRMLASD